MHSNNLLLLGTGQVARAVINQARDGRHIFASTRNPNRIFELADLQVEPLIMPLPSPEIIESLVENADVLVSFPPDGFTDAILAPACMKARSIVYISSTAVYGKLSGKIDDNSPVDSSDDRAVPRLQAESIWRECGAIVLRAPGIYGTESGLHKRLKNGSFKLPGDGGNVISRIHVEDLAGIILSIFDRGKLSKSTYVLGDNLPCAITEVVDWLCKNYSLPKPQTQPLTESNPTLRGNRAIDGSGLLNELSYRLRFADYKQGYAHCMEQAAASFE